MRSAVVLATLWPMAALQPGQERTAPGACGPSGPALALLAAMADALPWPLLLIDAENHLLHANRAASQGLRAGRGMRLQGGRLCLKPGTRQAALEAAQRCIDLDPDSAVVLPGPAGTAATLRALAGEPGQPRLLALSLRRKGGPGGVRALQGGVRATAAASTEVSGHEGE